MLTWERTTFDADGLTVTDPADLAYEHYAAELDNGVDLLDPDPYWAFTPGPTTAPYAAKED